MNKDTPRTLDLLVIGGGINGAGVARDASLRGLRVALVEQDDFASGSSSRTSKLVHGGLRYLEQGDLRLVWEACHERRVLLRLAPHLVRPLSFVLPVFAHSRVGRLRLGIGMWLYDLLSAFRNIHRHRMLSVDALRDAFPEIRQSGLRAAARYWDAAMDDARLTLENILAAREAGASIRNQTLVEQLIVENGRVCGAEVLERDSGVRRQIRAQHTVVCAGVWTERVLQAFAGDSPMLSPTRGTHVVTRPFTQQAWTLTAVGDGRVFFVLPWLGLNLIGTTDVAAVGAPEAPTASDTEIDNLLEETNLQFPEAHLSRDDVVSVFAGLRPLAPSTRSANRRSREHSILTPAPGLLAVVGGKYTTYRAVAEELVDRVARHLGVRRACQTAQLPLPGGRLAWKPQDHWQRRSGYQDAVRALQSLGISATTAMHWWDTYGALTEHLVSLCRDNPTLLAPLCSDLPHTEAEVVHAIRFEMAMYPDDWYLRRSRIGLQKCHGFDSLPRVAEIFARERGWNAETRRLQEERTREILEQASLSGPHATRRSA